MQLNNLSVGALSAGPGVGSRAIDFWVDSVSGSDSNTGATKAQAFQTLAKLKTSVTALSRGAKVSLVGNSRWKEELSFTVAGMDIRWDGTGSPPIVDAFDTIASLWVVDVTNTNNWNVNTAHAGTGTARSAVLKDGLLLYRRTTAALSNSNVGSYYNPDCGTANPVVTSINVGGNPNGDGHVYENCTRANAILLTGAGSYIWGVIGRGALSTNGPIELGVNCIAERCGSAYGTKHCALIQSGQMIDCVFYETDAPSASEPGTTMAVAYANDATGYTATFLRGRFYSSHPITETIYAHTLNDPAKSHARISAEQCIVNLIAPGAGFQGNAKAYNIEKCCAYGSMNSVFRPTADDATVSDTYGVFNTSTSNDNVGGNLTVSQVGLARTNTGNVKPIIGHQHGFTTTLDHVTLRRPAYFQGYGADWDSSTGGNLSVSNSLIESNFAVSTPTGGTLTADNNTYVRPAGGGGPTQAWHGSTYDLSTAFATYRTASGQDAHSTYLASTPFAGALGSGDFRPNGTEAPGAGMTRHWDYNLRQFVAGAPSGFPATPSTFAQMSDYIAAPAAWVH